MEMPKPKRQRKRRRDPRYGAHIEDLSPGERKDVLDIMAATYCQNEEDQIETSDERTREDLRMRVDGQPSARRPAASLPLSYWAVVESPPDGGEDFDVENKLRWYEEHLRMWKAKGLYDGPTDLTIVNPEHREDPDDTA